MEIEIYLARLRVCKRLVAGLLPLEMSKHRHPRVRVKAEVRTKASLHPEVPLQKIGPPPLRVGAPAPSGGS